MNETLLYAVRSDLEGIDDAPLYAEFADKESAISYAKAHLDALPYVECLTVSLDDSGEVEDIFKTETVWVYSEAPELDEAYDDPKVEFTRKEIKGLYGQKPRRSAMYDTLYANNTGVGDLQYEELSEDVIASDKVFQLDFPEYQKTVRGPELVADEAEDEEEEISFTAEEAVPYLIEDEEEAISSYQKAAEVVEDSDLDNKKEILDTIKHIQEDEEEHLTDLTELIDEEDTETLAEDVTAMVPVDDGLVPSESSDVEEFDGDVIITDRYEPENTLEPSTASEPYYDPDFIDKSDSLVSSNGGGDDLLPYGDGRPGDGELLKDKLVAAGGRLKDGASSLGPSLANTGTSLVGAAANAGSSVISSIGGAFGDLGSVSAMKAKLKNARLETEIEREHTAQATQNIKTNRAKKGAEWQNVGVERAKVAAAKTAARGRLQVANIDAQTSKAIAQQAPSVRNAQADLETARLQNQAQKLNAKTAKKIVDTADDVVQSRIARKAAWNQAGAQIGNAIAAQGIARQSDEVIQSTSGKVAAAQDRTAAYYKNDAEHVNADTAKQVAAQTPEVRQAYSKKFAAKQNKWAARHQNHEERIKANAAKYAAKQDPKVKKALADLETDKVHKQDTQVKTAIGNELAKQNPERDQAVKNREVQRVKLDTIQLNNKGHMQQNPKTLGIKKDIQDTKLTQKLDREKKKLRDYEQQHNLDRESDPLHEGTIFKGALPKRTKEYFRMLVNDYKPTTIFTEKMISKEGIKNPFTLKTYVVVYNGQGYEVDAYSAEDDLAEAVAYFQTYDEFWDYLREMIAQPGIAPEYNYIFTEGLHESMSVTDAVSIQHAAVPKITRAEFEDMLRRNGAVQVYHENPATFGSDIEDYYITQTPTGEYELISEDSRGRVDSETMFKNYAELQDYLSKVNKNPYLYIPDIILRTV